MHPKSSESHQCHEPLRLADASQHQPSLLFPLQPTLSIQFCRVVSTPMIIHPPPAICQVKRLCAGDRLARLYHEPSSKRRISLRSATRKRSRPNGSINRWQSLKM